MAAPIVTATVYATATLPTVAPAPQPDHPVGRPTGRARAQAAAAAAPLYPQCPAIGADSGCSVLIIINPDETLSIFSDPSQGPYDGSDDTLVGVENLSGATIPSVQLVSAQDIFDFDGDGICSGSYAGTPAGCPFGPTGYEGPGTGFQPGGYDNNGNEVGSVLFTGGLAPQTETYFGLEAAVQAAGIAYHPLAYIDPASLNSPSTRVTSPCKGAPVDCATGQFYHTFTDLSVPGHGLPLNLTRTYTSRTASVDGPLGYGWTDPYNMNIQTDATGAITVNEENGTAVGFTPAGTGYQPASGVLATLVAGSNGTFIFTRQDQTRYTFSAPTVTTPGQLLGESDRNGYITTLSYTGRQLTSITDPAGRSLTLSYTGTHLTRVVDPIGRTVSYAYDANGDLTDATDARGYVTHFAYAPATHLLLTMTDPRGGTVTNTYDAQHRVTTQTDALGRTTTFSYLIDATGVQTTTITDPRGNVEMERFQGNLLRTRTLGYGTPQAATWTYNYDPHTLGIVYTIDPDGHTTAATYDSRGNLLSQTDALSRTTTYAYDALNDTTAITDPLGVSTVMTYDASGNPLQIARPLTATGQVALTTFVNDPAHPDDVLSRTDPNGHTTTFTYDPEGDLTSVTNPAGDTTAYRYDLIGRRTAVIRPLGLVAGINPLSYTTTMTYDAAGDTTAITDGLGHVTISAYDPDGNVITTTDALGRQTVMGYDLDNERTSLRRPDGTVVATTYDADGNVTAITDPLNHTTTAAYDALNRRISVTDALGRTTLTAYDLAGNAITSTDPLGRQTVYSYDAANERTGITRPDGGQETTTYDADGRVTATADALGRVTTYTYDSLGHLTGIVDPMGRTTAMADDLVGNVITTTAPLGRTTVTTYDAADRPVLVTRPDGGTLRTTYDADGNVSSMTDPLGRVTVYKYDALDRLISTTDPLGHATTTTYDAVGNRIATTDPLSHTTTYGFDLLDRPITTTDALAHTTVRAYDNAGNLLSTTDALGHTTIYGYDAANEQTRVTQADGSVMRYGYDLAGNVITSTDALGRVTSYTYDAMNRVATTTDPLGRTARDIYDQAGQHTAHSDPMGRTTHYGYDSDGEPVTITYDLASTPDVTMTYDAAGRRVSMTDGTGSTTYQYDLLDRPITVTDGAGHAVGYGYDLAGNETRLTYPDGSTITRAFDAVDRLTTVTDPLGHPVQFSYDAADRLITTTYPTAAPVVASMTYNAADQLTDIHDRTPNTTLMQFDYGRDALDQLSTAYDSIDAPLHAYTYNALNQLTADVRGTSAVTTTTDWSPDTAGEITSAQNTLAGTTTTNRFDRAGELTAQRVTRRQTAAATYTYNADGDRTGMTSGATHASYSYDQADRLVSATVSGAAGAQQTTYTYNGDGVRMSKVVSGTVEPFTWDASGALPTLLQDGAARYIDGPDGLPIEMISGTQTLYFLRDQLGSTRGVLNTAGSLLASYAYDAYGTLTGRYGPVKSRPAPLYTPFLYAGQYTDPETGFQYLQARYYDPATQQFLTVDPLVDVTGQPYAYADANPLNLTDPTGLDISLWQFITGDWRLPTPQEAANTWNTEVKPETYSAAVSIAGFFDVPTLGLYSKLADAVGANVDTTSQDYRMGQAEGGVWATFVALRVNPTLALEGAGSGATINVAGTTLASLIQSGCLPTLDQTLASAASGVESGAVGGVAGPVGGTLSKYASQYLKLGEQGSGILARGLIVGLSGAAGTQGQMVSNSLDPAAQSNVYLAGAFGVVAGAATLPIKTRGAFTIKQASYFVPKLANALRTANARQLFAANVVANATATILAQGSAVVTSPAPDGGNGCSCSQR